jgi:hypothetical protein
VGAFGECSIRKGEHSLWRAYSYGNMDADAAFIAAAANLAAPLAREVKRLREAWKELHEWRPKLHACPDWDFLWIDKGDAEFEACGCFRAAREEKP